MKMWISVCVIFSLMCFECIQGGATPQGPPRGARGAHVQKAVATAMQKNKARLPKTNPSEKNFDDISPAEMPEMEAIINRIVEKYSEPFTEDKIAKMQEEIEAEIFRLTDESNGKINGKLAGEVGLTYSEPPRRAPILKEGLPTSPSGKVVLKKGSSFKEGMQKVSSSKEFSQRKQNQKESQRGRTSPSRTGLKDSFPRKESLQRANTVKETSSPRNSPSRPAKRNSGRV